MSGEAKLRRKGADQTEGDMNHSQSKEESNGDVRHENGADSSKHNGHTHESNGHKGPKPVNVGKAGLFSKLMMFLMLGSFFLTTSIYLVVEYKDGPVVAVIHSAISKEYAEVLIHHINDDLAPLVDSIKGSIQDGIQKVTGQDLVGNLQAMEKSKDLKEESLSNVVKKLEGKIETKEHARESKPGPSASSSHQPGHSATKPCEISQARQLRNFFEVTLRKDFEACLITYVTPQGSKYNCIVQDEQISSDSGCSGGLKPNFKKRIDNQNKWKFVAPFGLHLGKYTFVGTKTLHKNVYPDSDNIRSKNDLDIIPNANITSVEGNRYSLEVPPAFSFCLNYHKNEDIIKKHLSCLDCQMPHVEFSNDLTIMTVLKGREYLYLLVCSIPAKNTPFTYVVKLDTTQVEKSPMDTTSKVDKIQNMEDEISTRSSGKDELNQHAEHFITTEKSSMENMEKQIQDKGSQDNAGNGKKLPETNEGKMPQPLPWPEHGPVIASLGVSFYVPWLCFCVAAIVHWVA